MLTEEKIKNSLSELGIDIPLIFYEITDSTNTRAKEFAKSRPESERTPVLFVARSQSAGRGRLGRSFVSCGGGIYMSLLIYPSELGFDATRATAKAAVSVCRAVDALSDVKTEIKWVNDVYLGGKKLSGILCEGEIDQSGKIAYLVAGMGINVYKNAISEEISDIATSIEHEAKSIPDRSLLTAKVVKEFLFFDGKLYEEYKSRSIVIGKSVRVIKPTEQYEATVLDLNDDFSLSLERGGKTERLFTGEVSLKI